MHDEEETDTETEADWEQFEPVFKLNNSRQKYVKSAYDDENNCTYRKIVSKDKEERKLPSSYYKLDKTATLTLERLLDVRSLGSYHDVVGKGRSSVVVSAGYTNIKHYMVSYCESFHNAVKIYKLESDENLNKAIYKRIKTEFDNMSILRKTWSIYAVPYPVCYENNILVMSILGSANEPAQQLGSYPTECLEHIYHKIVAGVKRFYNCYFVHGNLNAENILIWRGYPYYVGWSHSVCIYRDSTTTGLKKLIRDCYFVTKFFRRNNVKVMSTEALFKYVSGSKDINPELLDCIHKKEQQKVIKYHGNPNRVRELHTPSRIRRFK
ncbi:serine/threonine-protein kinase RIO3-like [Leguminivora glycinivorella]|uniref:serine/threonine-protein kinase RIO3-like n=1 Tax=Leguminivora glycinivorella TaxID=1035111 RepID=UPI00200F7C0F|nr:serine/threonine-protein kinase RIO3-like [Leguminivora glycinivorella]